MSLLEMFRTVGDVWQQFEAHWKQYRLTSGLHFGDKGYIGKVLFEHFLDPFAGRSARLYLAGQETAAQSFASGADILAGVRELFQLHAVNV